MSKSRRWLTFVCIAVTAGSTFVLGTGKSWADDDETIQAEDAMNPDDAIRSEQPIRMDTRPQRVQERSTSGAEDK